MASTYMLRNGVTFTDSSVNERLGIRIGCDAARRIVNQNHALGGATLRLAADLCAYGAERTRDEAGNYRHARRSATIARPDLAKPRMTLEGVLAAEAWYASHKRVPSRASIAACWTNVQLDSDEQRIVRDALEAVIRDASTEAEVIRKAQDRQWAAMRKATRMAAKATA